MDFNKLLRAQYNRLIAEFLELPMELHPTDVDVHNDRVPTWLVGVEWYSAKRLKYNLSWDWLVPVIEAIEKKGYDTYLYKTVGGEQCFSVHDGDDMPVSYQCNDKLTAAYLGCVEFVKYYNKYIQLEKGRTNELR